MNPKEKSLKKVLFSIKVHCPFPEKCPKCQKTADQALFAIETYYKARRLSIDEIMEAIEIHCRNKKTLVIPSIRDLAHDIFKTQEDK